VRLTLQSSAQRVVARALAVATVALIAAAPSSAEAQYFTGNTTGCFPGAFGCTPAGGSASASHAGLSFTGTNFSLPSLGGSMNLGNLQLVGNDDNAGCFLVWCGTAFDSQDFNLFVNFTNPVGSGSPLFTAALSGSFDIECALGFVCDADDYNGNVTFTFGGSQVIQHDEGEFTLDVANQTVTIAKNCHWEYYYVWHKGKKKKEKRMQCDIENSMVALNGSITNASITTTPEPGTVALLATGLVGIGGVGVARRRRGKDAA
jgi:hypothetical protein